MNLSLQLARRFRRGKSSNRYISFVSLSSTLGIGLGCFVLIILLSVMNGFERELRERLLAIIPHAELFSINQQGIVDWREYQQVLGEDPRIKEVEPYTKITGMIQQGSELKAVELTGVQINAETNATRSKLNTYMMGWAARSQTVSYPVLHASAHKCVRSFFWFKHKTISEF